jgi:Arc/MetJ family transcription regulator
MSKHLVDIDDAALREARAELKTSTIRDTVNEALRRAGSERRRRVKRAFDALANADVLDREQAWR